MGFNDYQEPRAHWHEESYCKLRDSYKVWTGSVRDCFEPWATTYCILRMRLPWTEDWWIYIIIPGNKCVNGYLANNLYKCDSELTREKLRAANRRMETRSRLFEALRLRCRNTGSNEHVWHLCLMKHVNAGVSPDLAELGGSGSTVAPSFSHLLNAGRHPSIQTPHKGCGDPRKQGSLTFFHCR